MRKFLFFVLCVVLCSMPILGSASSRYYERGRERVEVRYRNAGERIVARIVDRALDKVLGPSEKDREERRFIPVVRNNVSSFGIPLRGKEPLVMKMEYNTGYRADSYTGNRDILTDTAGRLERGGFLCVFEPPQSGGYTLTACVTDYNPNTVSCSFKLMDNLNGNVVYQYNGYVSDKGMGAREQNEAITAVIGDFSDRFIRDNREK